MKKNKLKKWLVCVLALAVGGTFLAACGTNTIDGPGLINGFGDEEEPVMLIDYYTAIVGTVGGDGYDETVLYQNKDGSCEIHYYSKYESDEEESRRVYRADEKVIEEAYDIINKNKMTEWNDKYKDSCIDGAVYSLTFRNNEGEYVKVSTDSMPEDGINIMGEVAVCMDTNAIEEITP